MWEMLEPSKPVSRPQWPLQPCHRVRPRPSWQLAREVPAPGATVLSPLHRLFPLVCDHLLWPGPFGQLKDSKKVRGRKMLSVSLEEKGNGEGSMQHWLSYSLLQPSPAVLSSSLPKNSWKGLGWASLCQVSFSPHPTCFCYTCLPSKHCNTFSATNNGHLGGRKGKPPVSSRKVVALY